MTHPSVDFLDLQSALAGEFSLQRELGRGGMGVVYLARDVQLDRDVAIKVLPTPLATLPEARERFLREARMAAGLSHPHIVPIHRVVEDGALVYFVMSYVEGETLGERLRREGPLAPAEASRVMREVAWALAYAHGRGIVHRDVKPDNILLEAATGRAMVTDFGIAHGGIAGQSVTDPGRIMGTVQFMSPEQAAGDSIDGRSDIYALGVVGYLSVSGRLPYDSGDLPALLQQQAAAAAPGVLRVAPGLPPALAAAIDRCLATSPDARFPDGEMLAAALAPAHDARPALPPSLRSWLNTKNPLLVPYLGWSGLFGTLTTANFIALITGNRPDGPTDVVVLATIATLPIFPIVGFHINQAMRQFRQGYTLADMRAALAVARREREESESLERDAVKPRMHGVLRVATVGAATSLVTAVGLANAGLLAPNHIGPPLVILVPLLSTMLLGAISNALDVQFIPDRLRAWWQTGIRERLWNSKAGEWLSRRLGAPERSRLAGANAFRVTEVALGVAASELFAALPKAYKEQLAGLPLVVSELEARAAEARAEVELLSTMAPSGGTGTEVLEERRRKAASHLSSSVAALESVRLDLLRLHAGAGDLAPLTTLMDAARRVGDDAKRLADAQREVEEASGRRLPAERTPTPA